MTPIERALLSLDGLSVGDSFGQCFFQKQTDTEEGSRTLPQAPWYFTDDTEMSMSIVCVLAKFERIDQDALAASFAHRYSYDRAYGPSMHRVLARIRDGEDWRVVAPDSFAGQGSFGNGAAMRSAPIGAFFMNDLERVVEQAMLSAEPTHSHTEAIAGAVAVALAAAQASRIRVSAQRPSHTAFLQDIVDRLPVSEVRSRLQRAMSITAIESRRFAASILGNGVDMSAQDTVPYALWCASQRLDDFAEAMWLSIAAGGDRDTLCAIVGGIVACCVGSEGIPDTWRARREALPSWHTERY
jgi:ADP-ribosylglycohydrolase